MRVRYLDLFNGSRQRRIVFERPFPCQTYRARTDRFWTVSRHQMKDELCRLIQSNGIDDLDHSARQLSGTDIGSESRIPWIGVF